MGSEPRRQETNPLRCDSEQAEDEGGAAPSAYEDHAATVVCWLSTAAIFRQPSIRRNLICPLATRLKSRTSAASSLGSEPCVFEALERIRDVVRTMNQITHLERAEQSKNIPEMLDLRKSSSAVDQGEP